MYRRHRMEVLEQRQLLAITWVNEAGTNAFNVIGLFDAQQELLARAIVNRAIDDWIVVVNDQNFGPTKGVRNEWHWVKRNA